MENKTTYVLCFCNAVFTHNFKKGLTFNEFLAALPSVLRIESVDDVIVQYLDNDHVLLEVKDNEEFRYVIEVKQQYKEHRFYVNYKKRDAGDALKRFNEKMDEWQKRFKN